MADGTCNDCGKAFSGDVKAHYGDAHPGMGRFRFRGKDGVDHLVCEACGKDYTAGSHLKSGGQFVVGKAADPIDLFSLHVQSHEGE